MTLKKKIRYDDPDEYGKFARPEDLDEIANDEANAGSQSIDRIAKAIESKSAARVGAILETKIKVVKDEDRLIKTYDSMTESIYARTDFEEKLGENFEVYPWYLTLYVSFHFLLLIFFL